MLKVSQIRPIAVLLANTELFVKSLCVWFAAEEFFENIHFLFGAAALEDRVPVATAFFGVHGVGFEDGVEHVCGVDLRGEVAVVAGGINFWRNEVDCGDLPGIVPADQVAESGLTIAPVPVALLLAI